MDIGSKQKVPSIERASEIKLGGTGIKSVKQSKIYSLPIT